jgi:ubiquinone/menaquinone biosynthesis C-methylase UbiE
VGEGDFTRIAATMRTSADALVNSLAIRPGMKVLDLGCGDGTTALPEARLGADVLGVDIAANLVEAGRRRAAAEGLSNLRFEQGDASNLEGIADRTFDLVVSIFGAMFAPRPSDVAREMVRVTKPGGRIVMGNWIPNDPTLVAQILKISSAYSPPPPEGSSARCDGVLKATSRSGSGRPESRANAFPSTAIHTFRLPRYACRLRRGLRDYYRRR